MNMVSAHPHPTDCLRIIIADDEALARRRIVSLLGKTNDVEIVAQCTNGRAVVEAVREHRPELLFLDVQMPELDGFEALAELQGELPPGIIFVTAFDQHAVRAFEYHALDYLLKPFSSERFVKALQRARELLHSNEASTEFNERLMGLMQNLPSRSPYLQRLMIKGDGRIYFRNTSELDWIESEGNYVRMHFGAESHLQREKLSALEARLDPKRFARPHRSVLVNIDRIKEMRQVFHGDYVVVLKNGIEVPLGKPYRERFLDRLGGS